MDKIAFTRLTNREIQSQTKTENLDTPCRIYLNLTVGNIPLLLETNLALLYSMGRLVYHDIPKPHESMSKITLLKPHPS